MRPDDQLPPGVVADDGLTEDEAVAEALRNIAQLSVDLAAPGVARANLVDVGLLPNPALQLLPGECAARRHSQNRLFGYNLLACLGIVLVLYSDFQSARLTSLVAVSVPFALVGDA